MIVGSSVRRARVIMGDAVYALLDSVTPSTEPLHRPTAGTNYLYTLNYETTKNDWPPTAINGDRTGIRL